MAADWNGRPLDPNAAPEEAQTPTLAEEMLRQQAEADANRRLDADLLAFLKSPEARDEDRAFRFLDDYTKNRWGIDCQRGNAWTPDRQPYANARQYADAMAGVLVRGYSAIATPEYKKWMAAKATGDRAQMIAAAGIETTKMAHRDDGAYAFFDPGMGAPNATAPKTDAEIDDELKEYAARVEGQNFVDLVRTVGHDLEPQERDIVNAALKHGDGLPAEKEADFAVLCHQNPEKAARVLYLVNRSRRNEYAFWRDVGHGFAETWNKTYGGLRTALENTLAEQFTASEFAAQMSGVDSAKYYWNEDEKKRYAELLALWKEDPSDLKVIDPKTAVDNLCAARLAKEALPAAERNRQRREQLMVEQAMGHQPYDAYGFGERAVIGAVSTLPYMTLTAIPYAGFVLNAVSYFEQTRDDIMMAGGDPDEARGAQMLLAAAWSGIEQLEFRGLMGKPFTGLQRKAMLAHVWKAAGRDKLRAIGQLALATEKEALAKTLYESVQEGFQGAIEGTEKSWFKNHDLRKALADGGEQAVGDFVESIGSMGILGHLGAIRATVTANKAAADAESLADYAGRKQQVINILRGTTIDPEADPTAAKPEIKAMLNDITDIWNAAPSGIAAVDQIKEKYGFTDEQTRKVAEYLDLRQALLRAAAEMDDKAQGERIAAFAGNAFRVGQDTTYDPVDLLHLVNPNITVEDVEVPTVPRPQAEREATERADALRSEIEQTKAAIAQAKNRSERRPLELALRKLEKKLRKAEAKVPEEDNRPRMRVRKVTVPVGADGATRTFTLTENRTGVDIHSPGYAASVAEAMKDAAASGEATDGSTMSVEEFRALDAQHKLDVAVTDAQYLAMTPEERADYVREWNLGSGGDFRMVDDATGKEVFNTDAIIEIMRAVQVKDGQITAKPGTRFGGNWTLAHEYGHAISKFAREVGILPTDGKTVAVMRKLFGDPRPGVDELWNEEAANNGLAEYLRDKFDFKPLTPEERAAAKGFFKNAWATLKGIFTLTGHEAPVAPVEKTQREQALDAAYEALRSGDFSTLDAFAGIEFAEDKATPTAPATEAAATEEAPAAPETPSTHSAPTASPTPAPAAPRAPAASTPAPAPSPTVSTAALDTAMANLASDPEAVVAAKPVRTGTKRTVFTPGYEMSIEADAMWAPLSDLVESTDDHEVQMRDRSRMATNQQIHDKTRKGVFQPLALFPGTKSDDGAPIVGGGLRIISGHGRKRMLETLVREGRFAEYLDAVNAECRRQGMPTAPEGMVNPVLVLRVTGGLDKRSDLTRFAELSNRWGGLERSGAEHAESDARKITDALLRLYAPDASGNLLAASNRPFMAAFLKAVGATGLTNKDGTPTAEAALRVQRAMMAAIFGDDEKVRAMVQNLMERSGELSLATLQNALLRSAGKLLAMKRHHGSFDIVADVREAAYQYIAWRSAQKRQPKLTLADHLNEQDFFTETATPMQQALARLLEVDRFGTVLDKYGELVAKEAVDAQGLLGGIDERHTPLQLLGMAERAMLAEGETPVTPDPASDEAAQPVQTAPAVNEEPPPPSTDPLDAAQTVLAPPPPATFTPVPVQRGTATLPGTGAKGIESYQVNADGQPTTAKRTIPPGAYNLLRAPYDVRRAPRPSAQDKAGRGLGINNPPPTGHADIFPHFQGNKTDMAARTSQAIRNTMSPAERAHYTTVVDYFGGGGCWGLYHALENFPNARLLVVNEFDPDRLEKIRLLHEIDGQVADKAEALLKREMERLREAAQNSSSPVTIANKAEALLKREITDPRQRAVMQAFIDCAHTMLATSKDEAGNAIEDTSLGVERALDALREDGRKAKAAADEFKARHEGATIRYVVGDAEANAAKMPHGDDVMAVADPPYYLTADYQQGTILGLNRVSDNWSYEATRDFLRNLVDFGDGIVYTDEAWWFKESYAPNASLGDDLFGEKSDFDKEQEILLDIINTLDHFDVAGRVVGRQEVLGVHHGHETEREAENGTDGNAVRPEGADNSGGERGARPPVLGVAAEPEGEGRRDGTPRGERGPNGEGRRALAREVIVQHVADAIADAAPDADPAAADSLARHSVRQVREERMAEYAASVSKNARRWLKDAARRLDERMKAAGFTEKVWHGTYGEDFNTFKFSANSHDVPAAYFAYNRGTAQNYAALTGMDQAWDEADDSLYNTRQFYVNPGKVLDLDESGNPTTFDEFKQLLAKAYADGYNAVRVKGALDDQGARLDEFDNGPVTFLEADEMPGDGEVNFETDILIVMQQPGDNAAARVKAADPVTFMDEDYGGMPVPLDMRADQTMPDVRFSVRGKRNLVAVKNIKAADLAEDLARGSLLNPSVGIIAPGTQFSEYGEITLVLDKSAIAADTAIWEGDGGTTIRNGVVESDSEIEDPNHEYPGTWRFDRKGLNDKSEFVEEMTRRERLQPLVGREEDDIKNNFGFPYYEAKAVGEMPISVIKAAIVPKDASKEIVATLEKNGIKVVAYDGNGTTWDGEAGTYYGENAADRAAKVAEVADEINSVRFSVSRAAPMTAVEIARAVEYFGTTEDPKEAAYILPDGRWLDYEQMGEHWEISQALNAAHRKQLDKLLEFDGDAAPYIDAALNAGLVRVTGGVFDLQGNPKELGLQMNVAPDAATARNLTDFVDAAAERYPTLRTFTVESHAEPGFVRQYDMADPRALAQIKRDIRESLVRHSVLSSGRYYGTGLRDIAHGLKRGDETAIAQAADLMALNVPPKAVLVPMPGHEGPATTMLPLAKAIAKRVKGATVVDALVAEPHESNYTHKQRVHRPVKVTMHSTGAKIPKGRPVLVVDNVIASGATYRAAQAVIPNADLLTLADAGRGRETPGHREQMRHSVFMGVKGAVYDKPILNRLYDATDIAAKHGRRSTSKSRKWYTPEVRDEIYAKTGWWLGTDGLWRVEIPDMKPKTLAELTVGDYNGELAHPVPLTDLVSNTRLFKAYSELKNVTVWFIDADSDKMDGIAGMLTGDDIVMTWDDLTNLEPEDGEIKLTYQGMQTLTHEVQHYVQWLEGFATGGSQRVNGRRNYALLAGEVEARNAERRYGGPYGTLVSARQDEAERRLMIDHNMAPWQTEDVPTIDQLLSRGDGTQTDIKGNPVARQSVTRGRGTRLSDLATAFVASRQLAGKEVSVEDTDRLLKNMGLTTLSAPDVVSRAQTLAERNKDRLRGMVERAAPELVQTLARANMGDALAEALDSALVGGAAASDPEIGQRVQQAIQSRETRDLMAAKGFTAAQMMAELPVDLASAVLAVAEYEKTPEELARIEAARKKREEERAAEEAEDESLTPEERLAQADDPTYREPTDEERDKLQQLLDRARFAEEARKAEQDRLDTLKKRKAEETAAREQNAEEGEENPDEGGSGDVNDLPLLPEETVRRIAPVFESAELFAQFIVEWTSDHVVAKHPELPTTAEMWKSPVAVRELKQTATHILRKLAKDCLGSPSLNYSRNFADHAINELESDAEIKTFNAVRRKIANVYDQIHNAALHLSRRDMVRRLINGSTEKDADGNVKRTPGIRQLCGAKGRFSAIQEEVTRAIDAKTELWGRHLIPLLTMSEEKLAAEIDRLNKIVSYDPTAEDAGRAPTEDQVAEAADRLALAHKYGGMIRWMPGRIADAAAEILDQLNGKRQAFEQKRLAAENADKALRDALIAAVEAGAAAEYRKPGKRPVGRFFDSLMGNLTLEMQNMIRFCKDEDKRREALRAIEDLATTISEASAKYRVTLGAAQAELHEGLRAAYGNAEAGIKHLLGDEIPEDAAKAIFTQDRNNVPTYGRLLQLYATTIQADYKENAEKHGRTAQLALMEATLTDQDRAFHAWAVEWFKRNRKALSDSVEEVTGLPVTSPDEMYTPARMLNEPSGLPVRATAWSPVPSALNRRVRHGLDFNEGVNFLSSLQEQCEVRAQTIGYAAAGIRLRNVLAHHDVQAAVRKHVGKAEMSAVLDHVTDVLVQNAERKDESAFLAPLNVARRWMARFALSGNIPSALKQLASMPVWANAILDGKEVGLGRVLHYLTSVGTDEGRAAIRDLMESDGFKARYTMGWSEETQNVLMNPSKNRLLRYIEKAYDKGMVVNKAVDGVSCLWMAQGFYRDARAALEARGFSPDEAKSRALALTWSVCENGQQSGRIENMNALQRKGGAFAASVFQYKTAYLLQNNYIIQAARECRAGTPGAKGRLLRALFINTCYIPAFVALVNAAWSAIMGDEPPDEDPEKWPQWLKDFAWSMVGGVTAPLFILHEAGEGIYRKMTGQPTLKGRQGIPAVESALRVGADAATLVYDLGHGMLETFTPMDFEEEITGEKIQQDVIRLLKDIAAPARHVIRAVENRTKE